MKGYLMSDSGITRGTPLGKRFEWERPDAHQPRVIILGGGFAGIAAARELRGAPAEVVLIDRKNHHLFQPLLYQVAGCMLSDGDIASPIRELLRDQENDFVVMSDVTGIDPQRRQVFLSSHPDRPLSYDYLVVATGAEGNYFGRDEWPPFAPGMKTLEDAIEIRSRILAAFEKAELLESPADHPDLTTFVIVGGGPTGCELAGTFIEMFRVAFRREFRRFDPAMARVVLIEAGPRLLPAFAPELAEKSRRKLVQMGVEVMTGTRVEAIDAEGVTIGGRRIGSRTVIWAAGIRATPVGSWLGAKLDRMGRVVVDPDLTVAEYPELFVVGDASCIGQDGGPLPGVAPVAMQTGRYAGRAILNSLLDRPPLPPFVYSDKGNMATIGRTFAIMETAGIRLSGRMAKLAWAFLHIWYLMHNDDRLVVFLKWVWHFFTGTRGTCLIEGRKNYTG